MQVKRHLLAAFVLLHGLYALLVALPNMVTTDDKGGERHYARTFLWLPAGPVREQARDARSAFGMQWNAFRGGLRETTRPYARYLGTSQSWGMFSNPPRNNGRIDIRVRVGDDWHVIYRERSRTYTWRRWTFDHYRWREQTNYFHKKRHQAAWQNYTRWVADEVFADFPQVEEVRVSVWKATMVPPEVHRRQRGLAFDERINLATFLREER